MKESLVFWTRLILGIIFIAASVDKIMHPDAFARIIYNYQLLPGTLVNPTAVILPWLELILGVLLISGLWLMGATVLVNLLLIGFYAALLFNIARGLNVHCGCFTTSTHGDPATLWYLFRDSFFLLMGGYLFYRMVAQKSFKADSP